MDTGTVAGFLLRALDALNRNSRYYGDMVWVAGSVLITLLALTAFFCSRWGGAEAFLTKSVDELQLVHYLRLAGTLPS